MNIGTVLIYFFMFMAIVSIAMAIISIINSKLLVLRYIGSAGYYSKLTSILVFISVSGALLLLYIYFITSNMDIEYVWEYSSVSHPIEYKLSGVLAGMPGSLLFWIWCIVLGWFVEELIDLKNPEIRN